MKSNETENLDEGRRGFLKSTLFNVAKSTTIMGIGSTLVACGSNKKTTPVPEIDTPTPDATIETPIVDVLPDPIVEVPVPEVETPVNTAPEIPNKTISYNIAEGQIRELTFDQFIQDAGIIDKENDAIVIGYKGALDPSIQVKEDSIIFTAPNVDADKSYSIVLEVSDSRKAQKQNLTVMLNITDGVDDQAIEFNDSDLTVPEFIQEGEELLIGATAKDGDGIKNISYNVTDDKGTSVASGLFSEGVEDSIGGLFAGTYTVKAIATGVVGGENANSVKTVTKTVNVVADLPVQITNISVPEVVTQGTNLVGSFEVPETEDGITEVGYTVTSQDGNTVFFETPLAINSNGLYDINEDSATLGLGEACVVTIYAKDNGLTSASNVVAKREFTVEEAEVINTAPVAIDGSTEGNESDMKTFSMADVISDAEDSDDQLEIIVTQQPEKGLGGTVTTDGTDATVIISEGFGGDMFFKFKIKDSKGLLSNEATYHLLNFDNG